MFDTFWKKQRKASPDEPEYISMCKILEGSGQDAETIYELFDEYIPKDAFLPKEREEMCQYLITISEDVI